MLASTEVESKDMSLSYGVIETYEFDGWTLSYRYKPASEGYENDAPLLLIHPVEIGISSWFWIKFFEKWQGAALYAPDLIGCGVKNGADTFDILSRYYQRIILSTRLVTGVRRRDECLYNILCFCFVYATHTKLCFNA
jgi:hypothetical protein